MERRQLWFDVICPWVQGSGMSGGDRIWIEFYKAWRRAGHEGVVWTSEEGMLMAVREGIPPEDCVELVTAEKSWIRRAFMFVFRTIEACRCGKVINWSSPQDTRIVIYSASDFLPDSLPAYYAKKRHPCVTWVAGFYLFAPAPWRRPIREWIQGWTYWLTQKIAYRIILKHSDIMCVTTEQSKARVIRDGRTEDNVVVVRGGVDTGPANEWFSKGVSGLVEKPLDAVFVGRFHHTKGLVELVKAWKLVCGILPDANLAIIGEGEMESALRQMIISEGMNNRIQILGFLDGEAKYEVFKKANIFVNPTTYNGGMAAIEGMAWGLPAVGFDLESQKAYYPKGMIKVTPGDVPGFASAILLLLIDGAVYLKTRKEAIELAKEWDWSARAQMVVDAVERRLE